MIELEPIVFLTDDGLRLRGEGYGRGPVVLFTHGAGQTRYAWRGMAEKMAQSGWRSIFVDLRGHGESDWGLAKDYSVERYAQDTVTMAKALGGDVIVVGASLGGNSAIAAAGRLAPQLFRALVLVDVVPQVDSAGVSQVMGFMSEHIDQGFADYEEASRAVSAYRQEPARVRDTKATGLARYLRKRDDGRLTWHWDPAFVTGFATGRLTHEYALLLEADLRAISCPVLLLRGLHSNLVTDEAEAAFRKTAPNAEVRHVGAAGHMLVGDNNAAFTADLEGFLNGLKHGAEI